MRLWPIYTDRRDCVSGSAAGRRVIDWGVERKGGVYLW
jgi:hypothetical protein